MSSSSKAPNPKQCSALLVEGKLYLLMAGGLTVLIKGDIIDFDKGKRKRQ
ncbi:hypothetical protein [Neobacillus thermocopriae]